MTTVTVAKSLRANKPFWLPFVQLTTGITVAFLTVTHNHTTSATSHRKEETEKGGKGGGGSGKRCTEKEGWGGG